MKPSRGTIVVITLVVAAALVSGAGGAVAGVQIGTAQIKNGAVTTKKIRNGAVVSAKLGGNAVTSAKIKNGTVTRTDLAPAARATPPRALVARLPGGWHALVNETSTVLRLRLPAGKWALTAKAQLRNWDDSLSTRTNLSLQCTLFVAGVGVDYSDNLVGFNTADPVEVRRPMLLMSVVKPAALTTATVSCDGTALIGWGHLVALQVR